MQEEDKMVVAGKKVLVFGSGISGIGAVKLLEENGADVVLYDGNEKLTEADVRAKLQEGSKARIIIGAFPEELPNTLDLVILSPGVPTDLPIILKMKEKEIPVIGEVELAYTFGKGDVLAITGTNGKTTTKELLAAVLSTKFNLLYTEGNFNNHIGVPLTLLRLTHDHEMAVIEMGASHPGDIKELVDIVHPNYGIITNVGRAHLEGFGSFEGVIRTKGELYDYIRRSKGKIFIKKENEYLQSIAKGIEQITYGNGDDAFASGQVVSCDPFLVFNWKQQGKLHTVETHMIGSYNLDNVLAAVAVGRFFKIPAERISRAIAAYEPTNNRSQFKKTDNNELIIDAYNANPSSMKVALDNFITMPVQPKAIILGDMRELGPTSNELHAEVVEQIKKGQFDKVFLCGEHFSKVGKEFSPFATTEAMTEELRRQPLKGYHILIKGSHSMGLEKLADIL